MDESKTIDDVKTIFDRVYENKALKEFYLGKIKINHENKKNYEKKKPSRAQFNLNVSPEIRDCIKAEAQIRNISPAHLVELLFLYAKHNDGLIDSLINHSLFCNATSETYLQPVLQPGMRRNISFGHTPHSHRPFIENRSNQQPINHPEANTTTDDNPNKSLEGEKKNKNRGDDDCQPNII